MSVSSIYSQMACHKLVPRGTDEMAKQRSQRIEGQARHLETSLAMIEGWKGQLGGVLEQVSEIRLCPEQAEGRLGLMEDMLDKISGRFFDGISCHNWSPHLNEIKAHLDTCHQGDMSHPLSMAYETLGDLCDKCILEKNIVGKVIDGSETAQEEPEQDYSEVYKICNQQKHAELVEQLMLTDSAKRMALLEKCLL